MTFCTIPAWTKCSFLHRNSKLVILTKHPKSCIGHWKYEEAMIWFLNRHLWFFVKSRKSTVRTHSWESLERMGGGEGGVLCTLGSNTISKQSPQSCNESNAGVMYPKSIGLVRFKMTGVWAPEGPRSRWNIHSLRMNLEVRIGNRTTQTLMTT